MNWPWKRRAEKYEAEADEAADKYVATHDTWAEALELAEKARVQREMNGWTRTVVHIFAGGGR